MKAVFLDRDGVICKDKHRMANKESLELIENAAKAIHLLNQHSYKVIVITNQSIVARGHCSYEHIKEMNDHMEKLLFVEHEATIDKTYVCPHHPLGMVKEFAIDCDCRKPFPGMILKAKEEFNIPSLDSCFMIGDKTTDIKAGKDAGCKTILVKTGHGGTDKAIDISADHVAEDLLAAVKSVVLQHE